MRCLVEGCLSAPLRNAVTLTAHLKLKHQMTREEYVEAYGELVPMTEEEQAEPVEVHCEVEGCDTVYSTATGHRWPHMAMVSHMRGRHLDPDWRPGV